MNGDRLWAKSWDEDGDPPESVFLTGHLRDVHTSAFGVLDATAADQLNAFQLLPEKWEQRLRRVVLVAAALHDVGKANNHFRDMILERRGRKPQGLRHEWVMYWLAQQSPWKEWGPKALGSEIDWRIALWAITGHHPAYGRGSPPSEKPDACDDLEMTLLVTHPDFRFCVEWIEQLFGAGLSPTAVDSGDRKLKLAGLRDNAFHAIGHAVKADRACWKQLDDEGQRFVAAVKACLLAADVAGSYAGERSGKVSSRRDNEADSDRNTSDKPRPTFETEFQIERLVDGLSIQPQPDELEELVRERLEGKPERAFQTAVASSSHRVTFVKAGCGTGKTAAAYLWAARRWPGRRLYFCYPTTGTATEGFKDYLFDDHDKRSKYGARLFHSRSEVDADLILHVNREVDEQADPNERWLRADSMSAWSTPIVCCTIDRVIGLMQNERKGLMCWPALAQAAFVFDEIHAYDNKLFGLMLRFLRECSGLPVLLMTASLPEPRKAALLNTLRLTQPKLSDAELLCEVSGPRNLEKLKRYHRIHPESVEQRVREEVENGGRVLWVCNTVNRAMEAADMIADLNPMIYHSRFKYVDRVDQHNRVIGAFNPDSPGGVVAVCTQVAEMSLDLKAATLLVMDLCPVPAMIQRLGRLNRAATPPEPGEASPPTRPFCVVEPQKADGSIAWEPYRQDSENYGDWPTQTRNWLTKLAKKARSQRSLACAWQSEAGGGEVVPADCCWLDGGPTTTVDAVRESSPGVTVLMAEDALIVKTRKRRLAALWKAKKKDGRIPKRNAKPWQRILKELSLPMPQPHGAWQDGLPLNGIPVARQDSVAYDKLRGAKWTTR